MSSVSFACLSRDDTPLFAASYSAQMQLDDDTDPVRPSLANIVLLEQILGNVHMTEQIMCGKAVGKSDAVNASFSSCAKDSRSTARRGGNANFSERFLDKMDKQCARRI